MGAKGVNWASHLRRYASILNNEKKECLGWQSSFEVYFGRKSNTALDVDSDDFNADMMIENIHEPNAKDRLKQRKEDTPEWISVDRLSSTTIDEEVKRKQRASSRLQRRHHRAKYQIPLLDTDRPFALQGDIVYDTPGNGNCQFAALCHLLSKIGIFRSPRTLREQVVSYLLEHPYTSDGSPLELFVGEDWDTYISGMLEEGTYGDHITLQAVSDMFNVDIIVHSSLGGDATVNIVPAYSVATQTISLGHFAEEEGEHYVALQLHETQSEDQPRDGEGNRNLPRQVFDSANSGDEEHNLSRQHHSQCDDDEFLDMQGNINEGFNRTNSSDEEQGHSPSKDREPLDMQGDLNEGFYSTNSSDEEVFLSCRKDKMPQYDTQVAFTDLPNEVVLLIIEVSLQLAQQSINIYSININNSGVNSIWHNLNRSVNIRHDICSMNISRYNNSGVNNIWNEQELHHQIPGPEDVGDVHSPTHSSKFENNLSSKLSSVVSLQNVGCSNVQKYE
ncbi:uncharacterized protein [Haliotis cracherodii]|uniref:uncharacterized protein n=1 Tax=Haliotis cracherodii TaxID=6455 RepID=UPI0039EC46E8